MLAPLLVLAVVQPSPVDSARAVVAAHLSANQVPGASVAVARLWEQGKLDLGAPVQRYAPTFPDTGHPISTRQLAGHLSGLPHYTAADIVNRVRYPNVTAALDKFRDRPGSRESWRQ